MEWRRFVTYLWNDPRTTARALKIDRFRPLHCGFSRLLKVNHLRVTGNLIMHFMMPHNNIGFNSKGLEDMGTKITKKNR